MKRALALQYEQQKESATSIPKGGPTTTFPLISSLSENKALLSLGSHSKKPPHKLKPLA